MAEEPHPPDNPNGHCDLCKRDETPTWETERCWPDRKGRISLCGLCRSTLAGNVAIYPSLYDGATKQIVAAVQGLGHNLIDAIKEVRAPLDLSKALAVIEAAVRAEPRVAWDVLDALGRGGIPGAEVAPATYLLNLLSRPEDRT